MLRLLESVTFESVRDLGIAFPLRLAAHRQIHANLGALSSEMLPEPLENLLVLNFAVSNMMLTGPLRLASIILYLNEFASGSLALGAALRRSIALMDVSAY